MDTEGARALARRIAEGRPQEETALALVGNETVHARGEPAPERQVRNGVVYIRPRAIRQAREVRIFVRSPDGRLRRAR
jgi:hypothetical protein